MLFALGFVVLAALPEQSVSDPQTVTGGADAEECAWIDTVAVTGGGGLCTGALVHPRVVTYAAHCGDGEKVIRFGQADSGDGLGQTAATSFCRINPEYVGVS